MEAGRPCALSKMQTD